MLDMYATLLSMAAKSSVEPLQLTSFEVLSFAIVDALLERIPALSPIDSVVSDITEVHLDCIETLSSGPNR